MTRPGDGASGLRPEDAAARERALRQAAEARAEALARRLRAHYDGLPIPTYTWRVRGDDLVLVDCNAAARRATEGQIDALLGHTTARQMYDAQPDVRDDLLTVARTRQPRTREMRYHYHTLGRERWLRVTYYFVEPDLVELHTEDIDDRKRAEVRLLESESRLAEAQRMAHIGHWEWSVTEGTLRWSDEIYRIFGLAPHSIEVAYDDFIGRVHADDRAAVMDAVQAATHHGADYDVDHRVVRPDGAVRWVNEQGRVYRDARGAPVRMLGTVQDITARKTAEDQLRVSLAEKETLLREVHHRVKNNLQIVSSLLYLQSIGGDEAVVARLEEARARVRTMALIHETLHDSGAPDRMAFAGYLERLTRQLVAGIGAGGTQIDLELELTPMHIATDRAIPCGLLVNELVTNALKHGFAGRERGRLRVALTKDDQGQCRLEVADDGVGMPPAHERSLGLRLVHTLARQLHGTLELYTPREGGTCFALTVPGDARGGATLSG